MMPWHYGLANKVSTFDNSWKKKKRENFAIFRFDWKRTKSVEKTENICSLNSLFYHYG